MHTLLGTKQVPLTRKFAATFSSLASIKGDRDRETRAGRARIKILRRLVEEKKFHTPKWATATCNGRTYRMNGGHTSLMFANGETQIPDGMNVIVDEFACETREDLADLFDQFDARVSVRSPKDKIKAHLGADDKLEQVSATVAAGAVRGIAACLSEFGKSQHLIEEERIRLVHSHGDFLLWVGQYSKPRHMGRSGVVAAMFRTFGRSTQDATRFWTYVLSESHANNRNATRTLASFLKATLLPQEKIKWGPRAYYVKSIHAWNAWKENRTTTLPYFANAPLPKVL